MARRLVIALAVAVILLVGVAAVLSDDGGDEAGPGTSAAPGVEPAEVLDRDAVATTTTTIDQPDDAEVLAALEAVVAEPSERAAFTAIDLIGSHGDRRWVPYLVDLVRLLGTESTFDRAKHVLADVTGLEPPAEPSAVYWSYGSWMYDEAIDPGPAYIDWKAGLYSLIDPTFEAMIESIDDPVVAARIQWGGVRRGGIPALDEPATLSPEAASHMQTDELTFGVVAGGEARSYPHRVMDHHELANDVLGGIPIALVDCTLCRTGVAYLREVGGEILTFETSGLLLNSNKVMIDSETESLWNQLTGVAFAGPLEGTELDRLPITVTRYGEWVEEHPQTDVLAIPTGYAYSYIPGDAYRSYYGSEGLWFPAFSAPDVFPAKHEVATISLDGEHLAMSIEALEEAGPTIVTVAGNDLVVLPTDGGARFYDAPLEGANVADVNDLLEGREVTEEAIASGDAEWTRVVSGHSFWFAWYGNHPDTEWWPRDGAEEAELP